MATSIQFTGLNSSRVLPIPNPSLHFPSNMLKFAYLRTPSPSSVSCSVTRDPSSASSVVSLEEQAKTDNGSVLLQRPDSFGRFGKFGGKYVPETLMHALTELEAAFHSLTAPLELVRHIQYEQRMGLCQLSYPSLRKQGDYQ
ncbi:tryptophan synthase beta chain 2, chloroplastic-like [Cajanus cajan]|uniref:tryptophan synthase beta chain 2, chloroplastic-like n=1 Tax=Cajanus cajan TaxID=3821 RepID=UPI0010FAFE02|nr:tryptophan synthase beta chain 2, chloroplastic-like [Cajanus cajan]